ncbi:MAG: ABC transporter substrate-binding protein [Paracoccaceae bacterium]|nr:ABC transporter substrate-binding protein [Paracoccaceae bacterium]MDE3123840.1 ABC transporter substrate-binding protein [Paracoccaceae bacterium]MDE3239443.1 ABC transporter substrate-binding protein [Paracoccaceae bacterium]
MQKILGTSKIVLALGLACIGLATKGAAAGALPDNIVASKTLTVCSAVNLPPMEFFSANQKPEGVDIDLANELAGRLHLTTKIINIPFAGLIPALLAHNCDVIMSQLFIKPPRLKVIDEIPYMYSQEGFIIKAGKPKLKGPEDLSGKKAASVTGTTATDLMKAANEKLAAAGKPPITIVLFPENTPALQQVQFGQVEAYGVAYETALYYAALAPSQFQVGGDPYFKILTGIGVSKDTPGLRDALTEQLAAMRKDGTYAKIFTKWHIAADMLPE